MVHAADEAAAERAVRAVQAAYRVGTSAPEEPPLILKRVG
jgi:thymidine phosphorylase